MSSTDNSTAWQQLNLWCADWRSAETMATNHLAPLLLEQSDITNWWFIRKGPSWRLRFQLRHGARMANSLAEELTSRRAIQRYAAVTYEPEVHAFGGTVGMQLAHRLFHLDSVHILRHFSHTQDRNDHRRELGIMLGSRLLRGAGQDFYEQGDVWARVAQHRSAKRIAPSPATIVAVKQLLTAVADEPDSPLAASCTWPEAFEDAGAELSELHHRGELSRGLRAVLTHHVLFALNRLGISSTDQHLLASAAATIIFHHEPSHQGQQNMAKGPDRKQNTTMTQVTAENATADPQQLRQALVDHLDGFNVFESPEIRQAFLTVPRERFLPGVDLETAYAPKPVVTKRADDQTASSSASSPYIVAKMLEQLDIQPGHRVLEIGAATGINAALLSELVGPSGKVVTIEYDDDLTQGAIASLAANGYGSVKVICGDGAFGDPDEAPYDRIIVTAGAWDISQAWWQQLAPGGRIVVPLRLHGSGLTRSLAFDLQPSGQLVSTSAVVCGFVPMRGEAEEAERHIRLADDIILKIDATDAPNENALAGALTHAAHQHWTGIGVRHDEPAEHLDLWLATAQNNLAFGRISVTAAARKLGIANPALRWSGGALYRDDTLAYIAVRPINHDADQLGIITHGPASETLIDDIHELLVRWGKNRPGQPTAIAVQAGKGEHKIEGALVERPDTQLTICW